MKKIVFLSLLIFFISCDEDKPITGTENDRITNQSFLTTVGNSYSVSEIKSSIDNNNLNGIISLKYEKRNDFVNVKLNGSRQYIPYDDVDKHISAALFDDNGDPISIENFSVNGVSLREDSEGAYFVFSDNPVNVLFDGTNNDVWIEQSNNFPEVDTTTIFTNPITISSLSRGDTVSQSSDFTVNWSGGGSKVQVSFSLNSSFATPVTIGDNLGFSIIIDNTGSFLIPDYLLQEIDQLGLYDLTVSSFDYNYLTMTNNKDLCVLGISSHNITLDLTN